MAGTERASGRTALARAGFSELGDADRLLTEVADTLAAISGGASLSIVPTSAVQP